MFAVRYPAERAPHRAFELGRIIRSLIDPSASRLEQITESSVSCHATRKLKPSSRIRRSPIGHQSPRYDLRYIAGFFPPAPRSGYGHPLPVDV